MRGGAALLTDAPPHTPSPHTGSARRGAGGSGAAVGWGPCPAEPIPSRRAEAGRLCKLWVGRAAALPWPARPGSPSAGAALPSFPGVGPRPSPSAHPAPSPRVFGEGGLTKRAAGWRRPPPQPGGGVGRAGGEPLSGRERVAGSRHASQRAPSSRMS